MLFLVLLTLFAFISPSGAGAHGVEIEIAQPLGQTHGFQAGMCDVDAAEVLEVIRQNARRIEFSKIRVLIISNVFVQKPWVFHFVVWDGSDHIYDPGFKGSLRIEPVALDRYLAATADRGGKVTQLRAIEPEHFLKLIKSKCIFDVFHTFGSGMQVAKHRSAFEVSEAIWQTLQPIQTRATIRDWLLNGQFDPRPRRDLPATRFTLFPRAKRPREWYEFHSPAALSTYCRRVRCTLAETIAAATWADIGDSRIGEYLDLINSRREIFSIERLDKFDLPRLFDEVGFGDSWPSHPLALFISSCEDSLQRQNGYR